MPFGATHFPTRSLAETALSSFFKEIIVLGSENVPEEGPMLVACSHTNMVIDVSEYLPSFLEKLDRAVSARLRVGKWVAPNGISKASQDYPLSSRFAGALRCSSSRL
jgi:hypothetical protein